MSKLWFTSDTHFGHALMLDRTKGGRPFASVDEMDEAMVNRWNESVHKGDRVIHLGDVSFHRDEHHTATLLRRLNGQKFLLRGNHDRDKGLSVWGDAFIWCRELEGIRIKDDAMLNGSQYIVCCHYPLASWNQMSYGAWMLHGHSHHNLRLRPTDQEIDLLSRCVVGLAPNLPWDAVTHDVLETEIEQAHQLLEQLRACLQLKRLDVGVDGWNYTPVAYETLRSHLQKRTGYAPDHHEQSQAISPNKKGPS